MKQDSSANEQAATAADPSDVDSGRAVSITPPMKITIANSLDRSASARHLTSPNHRSAEAHRAAGSRHGSDGHGRLLASGRAERLAVGHVCSSSSAHAGQAHRVMGFSNSLDGAGVVRWMGRASSARIWVSVWSEPEAPDPVPKAPVGARGVFVTTDNQDA